eukprot:TRINITY_DN6340_c0_g1_i1.p2 TRINITY_DN6340_c0_g1~~TRINITY_DN6340_c0_g1_i1.p2  ORF type:complete len:100 (+),score=8.50 TRINITY_DN6340_c0_g1_i1:867-1166(+)
MVAMGAQSVSICIRALCTAHELLKQFQYLLSFRPRWRQIDDEVTRQPRSALQIDLLLTQRSPGARADSPRRAAEVTSAAAGPRGAAPPGARQYRAGAPT